MAKKEFQDENGKTYVAKEKKPIYKRVWFWILAIIIIAGIYGTTQGGNDNKASVEKAGESKTSVTTKKESEEKPEYELKDVKVQKDDIYYYVTGILKNNTDEDKSYVEVQFEAKDKDGNKIGDAFDNVNNIKAGGTWKFKAMLLDESDGEPKFDLDNPEISGF